MPEGRAKGGIRRSWLARGESEGKSQMGPLEVEAYLLHVELGEAVEDGDGVIDEFSGHPTFWLQRRQVLTPPEGVSGERGCYRPMKRQILRVQSFTPVLSGDPMPTTHQCI